MTELEKEIRRLTIAVANAWSPEARAAALAKRHRKAKPATSLAKAVAKAAPVAPLSERAQKAKAAHVMVDKVIQRYAEEHNEPAVARALGGISFKDNEPVDIVVPNKQGVAAHGIELKTVVANTNGKITMKGSAMKKKRKWERANKATFHTVVLDDSKVFNAKGPGKHDLSKRRILYRRGMGSFRMDNMHEVKNMKELRAILDVPTRQLPPAAKRR